MDLIIYIGRFYPQSLLNTLWEDSRGKASLSNHNFEMSILNGLCLQNDITLKCLTVPSVFSYPYNNNRFYTRKDYYKYKNTQIRSVGFCNLPVIKEIWSTIMLIVYLIRTFLQYDGDRVDIIINTPNEGLLKAVRFARIFTKKKITQTIIIPDIPSMVTAMDKQNPIKAFLLKHINRRAMIEASKSDGLVLLTEAMMDFVNKPVNHIVMEGIVDVGTMDVELKEEVAGKKIILYTGTLRKIFGVMNLVRAFQLLDDPDAELWICGSGDSKEDIENAVKQDSRIKFFGLVDSQTALKMQCQAMVLVNPRTSEGEYTKYSFPSKTMEYLLSGKSTIINRLPGIPDEYYDFVYTPKDESVEALTECILSVLTMDSDTRKMRAKCGREFIISQKNSKKQTRRILDMINRY